MICVDWGRTPSDLNEFIVITMIVIVEEGNDLTLNTLHHPFVFIVIHRFSTSTFRLTSLTSGVTRFSTEAELEQVFISCVRFISLLRVEVFGYK